MLPTSTVPHGALALCLALLSACGGDDDAPADAGLDGGALDGGALDGGNLDAGPPPPPDVCDALDLPRRPFVTGTTGSAFGDVARDFTVETLDGPFTLSEAWSGCESYVFINYFDADVIRAFWSGYPDRIFERSARTAQYFFASYDADPVDARTRVQDMKMRVDEALALLDPADADFWRPRVHYVTTPLPDIDGIGALLAGRTSVQLAFAIDRAQRYDPVGSLAEVGSAGFVNRLGMAGYASRYYDFRASLDARLEAESASTTIVPLVDETDFSEREFDRDATLPDAAAMAAFDTLSVDVSITCHTEPQDCSEWDRIAAIFVCTDDTCDTRHELVRWITPYARPGNRRWVMDASPLLGLLRDGGARRFRIVMGPTFEDATVRDVSMSHRLATRGGSADDPIGAELAFTGGPFDAAYDALHPPFHFTPPAGTTRVELYAIVSGHGQTPTDNCAEWCDHQHTFRANGGVAHRIDYPGEAGSPLGCAAHVDDGVIPGQYGNWAPSRAGWCPGWPVQPERIDITSEVMLGAENELTYAGTFRDGEPHGGDIELSVYVVYFR